MKVKQKPIAAAVSLTLLSVTLAAQAQTAETKPAKPEANQLEQVVVTGIRASQEKSLSVKRNADTHVDVISAEDIGKMPDKNVADSLARVPGVTILNSPSGGSGGFDERDRVGLRGTNPSLTQTLLNGHAVANGDWFVLDQTGSGVGRSVSYSLLPSELVSRVEVHKNAQASDIEGGTAGSVNIITRKPLDFAKALTFEARVGAVHADLPKKTDPQLSALLNYKNDQKTFGVLVQVFNEKRSLRRDGVETLAHDGLIALQPFTDLGNGDALIAAHPQLKGATFPNLMGSAYFTQERERKGGLISAQIKPTKDIDLTLTGFSSKMDADNYNRNYLLSNWWSLGRTEAGREGTISNITVDPTTKILTSASYTFTKPIEIGAYDLISRKASAETGFVSLDGSWKVSDALKFKGNVGTSNGKGKTLRQDVFEGAIMATASSFKLNGGSSAPSFSITQAPAVDGVTYPMDWVFGDQNVVVQDKETWAQVDGEYALDAGMLRSLSFGLRGAEHKRYTDGPIVGQGPGPDAGKNPIKDSEYTGAYPSNFGSGLGSGFPTNIRFPSAEAMAAWGAKYANRNPETRRRLDAEYSVKESVKSAFVQGNLEGDGWSGNVGLRVVNTKTTTLIWVPTADKTKPGWAASPWYAEGGAYQEYNKHSYTDLLPSASVRIDVTPKVVARLALSRTLTRPDYTALSAARNLGGYTDATGKTIGTGSAGNPDLDPIRSTNFDANVEWYFAPRAFVSMGAFHMHLGSYITEGVKRGTYTTDLRQTVGGPVVPPGTFVTAQFDLQTQINKKASVTGLEFAFETPVFQNFGISGSYTYADAHDEDGKDLRGSVKHSANLGGYYENDNFSARVNYGYSSNNYLGRDRGSRYYQQGGGVLSASLGYKFNDNFALSLDAQNLNDPTLKYFGDFESQPRAIYKNGRQFYVTATIKY
ncbi:TonB-dependent receptor [Kinneretia aquatilis]|uniref:TonB-dependent receptor n=1 Tax=Kinneretia aquatilis TaxID=2070761 RepID=UPI00149527B2|nr:TonB-dependent receptor [Paucibacter aquatile]WIV98629.1 TonB-dependent receptor [Paucibacter aquatile]